jgi:RHH-type proline utilization regulon transcriptional repressor/proline dehydrogenase/delta 1-pyrroline-5-carboxylate dehydrogenase
LEPKQDADNPNLWTPGIKLGVKRGSFMHQTELFGPVLGVMCANDLDDAIEIANDTPYGLTAGIHTLDEREHVKWKASIQAGNCYINRTITGAIVGRQPFGGCKDSSFGLGAKAGGPNYVLQLMRAEQKGLPKEREPMDDRVRSLAQYVQRCQWTREQEEIWSASVGSYVFYWNHYFSKRQDPSKVLGQDNFLSYVPHEHQLLRIQHGDTPLDVLRTIAAALTCKASFEVSMPMDFQDCLPSGEWCRQTKNIIKESEDELIRRIVRDKIKRVRLLAPPSGALKQSLADEGCHAMRAPVSANGRIELLYYLREVSLSFDYHRYGFLGQRENIRSPSFNAY